MNKLTHLDQHGSAKMVDVSDKQVTDRVAIACAQISMQTETLQMVKAGNHKKGDVLTIAKIAGIQAAKQCSNLIPLCHPLSLNSVDVDLNIDDKKNCINIESKCRVTSKTGVEMEALTAASVAALTIYDMCKAVDRSMEISNVKLLHKSGGKSGEFNAKDFNTKP